MTKKEMAKILEFALGGLDHLSGDHGMAAEAAIQQVMNQLEEEGKSDPEPKIDFNQFYE